MQKMTAAKAIVEVMVREGVTKAFSLSGESFLSVLDELHEHPTIDLITGRQEGGVSFMTEGYAKASGNVGVCFATRGPGATNLSIGLHTAKQDSTPLVAFLGQVESNFQGREGFQEVNFVEYFSHLVKWTTEIRDASRAPELVHRAFHMARSGRPGPVVVSLPQDILDEVAEMKFQESVVFSHPRPEQEAIQKAKDMLVAAKRPVILAGGGVTKTKAASQLVAISESLGLPVVAAFRRFDAFPNQHPHFVGALGPVIPEYFVDLFAQADVVLALGTRFSQITTQDYTLIPDGAKIIHVDISADEINKVYRPALGIVADVKHFISELHAEVKDQSPINRTEYIQKLRADYEAQSTPQKNYSQEHVNLEGMMHDLMEILPKNAILTNDSGNFFGWLHAFYTFNQEGTYIGPTSGAMGYGMPAAIGAKVAHPERTVVSFSGDGGFMMTLQEIETAVRNDIPIISIVANNNMYGTIRMHQEKHFPRRVVGTELTNPNFADIAKSMGGHGEFVEKNEDFIPALRRALEANKPAVIEVKHNPEQITVRKTIEDFRQ